MNNYEFLLPPLCLSLHYDCNSLSLSFSLSLTTESLHSTNSNLVTLDPKSLMHSSIILFSVVQAYV